MTETCRTCLVKTKNNISIYGFHNDLQKEYSEMLDFCASIKVNMDDPYSKALCQNCVDKLIQCYEFITSSQNAQNLLKNGKIRRKKTKKIKLNKNIEKLKQVEVSKTETCELTNAVIESENDSKIVKEAILKIEVKFEEVPEETSAENKEIKSEKYTCCFCKRNYVVKSALKRHYVNCSSYTLLQDFLECFSKIDKTASKCKLCGEKVLCYYEKQTDHAIKHLKQRVLSSDHLVSEFNGVLHFFNIENSEQLNAIICKYCGGLFSDENAAFYHLADCLATSAEDLIKKLLHDFFEESQEKLRCQVCANMVSNDEYVLRLHLTGCVLCPNELLKISKSFADSSLDIDKGKFEELILEPKVVDLEQLFVKFVSESHISYLEQDTYKCNLCEKTISERDPTVTHVNDHFIKKSYQCDVCYLWFDSKRILREHKAYSHQSDQIFECNSCPRRFIYEQKYIEHRKISHEGLGKYQCDKCGQRFLQNDHMIKHQKIHDRLRKHLCTVCGQSFTLKENLNTHMLTHSNHKRFICQICNKRFMTAPLLKLHSITHSESRPYSCNICGCQFKRPGALRGHMAKHNGTLKKNFVCSWCQKRFARSFCYKQHILTHTGEKPHQCRICGRKFSKKYALTVHTRLHTGERPHVCKVANCGKDFAQAAALHSHYKHNHSNIK